MAEDLVQNVFIQLWEKGKFASLNNPEAFLLHCVRQKCFDYLRSNKNRKLVLMKDLPDIGEKANFAFKEEDIEPLLSYLIAQLPPKMKQVFHLSREQKFTYKEIAEKLDISVKTVENQMGTALKKMRTLLKDFQFLLF